MKIKNCITLLMLFSFVLSTGKVQSQSINAQLLKTRPAVTDKKALPIKIFYKYSELRAYELTLANGVHIAVRADEGRKDVLMTAVCPGGASVADDQDFQSAVHSGAIVGNSGFGDFNGAEVTQFLQQKNITLTPGIDEKYSTLKGSFSSVDLETYLQAITLYFTAPRKDQTYFEAYIKNLKTAVIALSKNPYSILKDTVAALCNTNKNRVNTISSDNIKKINLDKAYDVYRKCFGNANGYTFVFTGDFKVDAHNQPSHDILNLISGYLGSLPSSLDSQKVVNRNTEIPAGKIFKKVHSGRAPLAAVQMIYSGNYQHTDSVNLQLKVLPYLLEMNLDTLDAFSGTNKASVRLTLNKFPKQSYAINIAFKCPPTQVDKLLALVHLTVAELQQGIRPEQLSQYIALRKRELKLQTFDYVFWRDYLALQFMNHDDPYDIVHYPYNFHKATAQTLRQAASEFLTDTNYIQAILLPAKK
jgi:zinc protease